MSAAKTPAQRQAKRKEREEAAGRKLYKRWIHPDDFAEMDELAVKLARKRERRGAVRRIVRLSDLLGNNR